MIELSFNRIIKHYGDNLILNNISFQIFDKERVGIVGANGSGKSTILKLIAGIEPLDRDYREIKGYIRYNKGATVAYLDQLPSFPDNTKVKDILNQAFAELHEIGDLLKDYEKSMMTLTGDELSKALKQYSELQQSYEVKGGYEIDAKLTRVCIGLKFNESFLEKSFDILSGGEKTTVILGKILLQNPDILLLDEPTNHLDMDSVEWLEEFLKSYTGMVIIVSHDRYFLDNVATKIIELENNECDTYKGNYTDYVKQKDEKLLLQYEQYKEQQKKINTMEKQIRNLRDWAIAADNNKFFRRAASIQKKLDKMEVIDRPVLERQTMLLDFKAAGRSGNDVIKVKELYKAFGQKTIFHHADMFVKLGERVALIGPNGSGKTTFLKLLLGEMPLDAGTAELGASIKLAYLPQNVVFNNEELMLIDCFREDRFILEGKAREYLSKFMFYGKSVFKKVKHLSGGEKSRLKLAMLLFDDINLLILDEPTNHLDIDSIEALEEALADFKGTIFFISHDRYFINKVSERVVAIEAHKLVSYSGNYDHYKNLKIEAKKILVEAPIIKKPKPEKDKTATIMKKNSEMLAKLEASIALIEGSIKDIDHKMTILGADYDQLNLLFSQKEELSHQLDQLIEEWDRLSNNITAEMPIA